MFMAPLWILKFATLVSACLAAYGILTPLTAPGRRGHLRGRLLFQLLTRMGPASIKIGQILSTQGGLFSAGVIAGLSKLLDDVPPCGRRYVQKTIETDIGKPMSTIFESFDWQAVASASIAQVHRGVLASGQCVAVKVIRRGVPGELKISLGVFGFAVRLAHHLLPSLRQRNLPAHFAKIERLLLLQADLRNEANNQTRIRRNFEGHPFVRVPRPYAEYSGGNVLVMEFMDGLRGLEFAGVELAPPLLACRLQEAFYTMAYLHGVFHADLHPGNIMFTKCGEIILLDFGVVGILDENEKWGLCAFYYAATRGDWKLAVERFTRYFVIGADSIADTTGCGSALEKVLRKHFELQTNKWSTIGFAEEANLVLRDFGARFTTNFSNLVLAFVSGEGFVARVDPDIDIWNNARRFTDRASPYMSQEVRKRFDSSLAPFMPRSVDWRARAARSLVAPTHLDPYMLPSEYPIFVRRAQGCEVEDFDGNTYIDLACGFGPHLLGYGNPVLREALTAAVDVGVNAIGHAAEVELAEELTAAFPGADKVIFANSGTEAVLQALRLTRAFRKRRRIAKFEGHYHGHSDQGVVSSWFRFAGTESEPEPFIDLPGVDQRAVGDMLILQYGDPLSLRRLRTAADELACVICEPMPSTLGCYDREFLLQLRAICSESGVPLIFDEIVTGFRVAFGGIQTLLGIEPDVSCLGKIIGGGLPCAAVVGHREIIDLARGSNDPFIDSESKVFVGGTFSGNAYSCTAGLAILRYLRQRPEIYVRLDDQTRTLVAELKAAADSRHVAVQVSGTRSILTLTFDHQNASHFRGKQTGTNHRANLALSYYMRRHRVHLPELHTMLLNAALEDVHISTIIAAFDQSLAEMVEDGFFLS
uniref:Aminotransferase n=1 Tax=Solibacter usitatus (strain Ellin6076) TaxID=234267 RepID=Q027Z3_SOLUE